MAFVNDLNSPYPNYYLKEIASNIVCDFIKECKKHKTSKCFSNKEMMIESTKKVDTNDKDIIIEHTKYKLSTSEYDIEERNKLREFVEDSLKEAINGDINCCSWEVKVKVGYIKKSVKKLYRNKIEFKDDNKTFAIIINLGWGVDIDKEKEFKDIEIPSYSYTYNYSPIIDTTIWMMVYTYLFYTLINSLNRFI